MRAEIQKQGAAPSGGKGSNDYVIRVLNHPDEVGLSHWQTLLEAERRQGREAAPFMTPQYLGALLDSGSAVPATGWVLQLVTLWSADGQQLLAAAPLYLKSHSYGEYVFDWAWADAHARHGLAYYPKGVVAVPFTPVPGPRLLAVDAAARLALVHALVDQAQQRDLSSLHLLFAHTDDVTAAQAAGLMLRQTVQFHWTNRCEATGQPYTGFDDFLATLSQDKRKKVRQEQRKVREAGVGFRVREGANITPTDWDFFYRCYQQTYLEHGNAPYLSRDFFTRLAQDQPQHWVMFVAERAEHPIACSLIAVSAFNESDGSQKDSQNLPRVAYGRYWGALERVDCLHFDACYHQPLAWCIAHGFDRFEGGAQGEHKMARALMPVSTTSAHWLAHPAFADAIDRYLQRETEGVAHYLDELHTRSPFRQGPLSR